ncbi:Folylpolyglutamate synthase [Chryseobacterium carnipullorum]|uniref:tetrahydrofolate synthase n=1 Tax=Chryseobacterium carnipullorum TaxID=1124835 RepID=A0A376EPF2_CHRCU|nr:Folylpolyglutamate synthase [Chryseobacterium carnipullorum]
MTNGQYQEAVDWLFVQAPNYQIDGLKAYKPGLENITKLCDFFGNPQEKIKCIHIGGTNGKGSSSNMLASVLQDAGYKVGLYNSPHLIDFTERIKINGKNCDKEFVYHFIQKLQTLPEDILPSFFEFTTIMAFEYFYQQKVDFAIIEVGLGGRLDSTNIIKPLVAAITNVQLDHQNILGDTIEEIASEKAGIIKPHIPIISGEETDLVKNIIRQKAENENAPFIDATTIQTDLISDLKGNYQKKNIRVVLGLIDELKKLNIPVSDKNIENGLLNVYQSTGFIGRWFEFSKDPLTICDTGHNQAGLEYVFSQLNSIDRHKHVILGFVNDKKNR